VHDHISHILREGLSFGEGPRWHQDRLWYSDFYRHGVYSMAPHGADERLEHEVAGQPSGLGWTTDGDLLCVSAVDQRVVRFRDGVATTFADISPYCGFWANDMVVSNAGHAYVGSFGFDLDSELAARGIDGLFAWPPPTTNLVVLSPDGDVVQVIADMAFPNGSVITPDQETLIVGETFASRLTAFTIDSNGTLRDRRVWAQLVFVAPDGMCLDADGAIWVANGLDNRCLRVREGGEVIGSVTTTLRAFACVLGASDRRTLFIMTAPSSDRFKVAHQTLGRIEATRVEVPGAGTP
jgi:sugar lactone lactonase YvrE